MQLPGSLSSQQPYTEQELLDLIASGDAAAYAQLHDAFYNSLVFFSMRMVNDIQQAEDIVLEALTGLWRSPVRFETMGKLKAYLFTLVRNASLNFLKRRKIHTRVAGVLSREGEAYDSMVNSLFVESDLARLVYHEIERLPEAYREVITLLYLEELPVSEAAERLGIGMENLRQRKARALRTLRNELVKKGCSSLLVSWIFL